MFCAYHRKGQIAAYLVGVMIVILIGILVTVRIGKTNINKTYTSNASDAGALAGATMVANGLNTVYDLSTAMFANALSTQLMFLMCPVFHTVCWVSWVLYATSLALELVMYAYAWTLGNEYCNQAETASIQLAFSNAGVKGDKKAFEDFMESLKDTKAGSFSWADTSGGTATVSVTTDGPGEFKLIPFVMIIWFKGYMKCPEPYSPPCCCSCCCYCGPLPFIWGIAAALDGCDKYMVRVDRYEPDFNLTAQGFSQSVSYGTSSSTSWAQAYNAQWGSCWTCSKDDCCETCVLPIIGGEYDSWIVKTN